MKIDNAAAAIRLAAKHEIDMDKRYRFRSIEEAHLHITRRAAHAHTTPL